MQMVHISVFAADMDLSHGDMDNCNQMEIMFRYVRMLGMTNIGDSDPHWIF